MQRKMIAILVLILILASVVVTAPVNAENNNENTENISYTNTTYEDYIISFKDAVKPDCEITIDAENYLSSTAEVSTLTMVDEVDNHENSGLLCGDSGLVSWNFTVLQEGFYELSVLYYNIQGNGNEMERALFIDGEIPYSDAGNIVFSRTYTNDGEKIFNKISGNEVRRSQKEVHTWTYAPVRSSGGYHDSNLLFYLTEGKHTLSLKAISEKMVISEFKFSNSKPLKKYSEVEKEYEQKGYKNVDASVSAKVQGEDAVYKSSSTLYAVQDRSSSLNEPYDIDKIYLNCIGGTTWKYQGAWIEWEIDAPESGLYNVALRIKQNFSSGVTYTKSLSVDGEIPFSEAASISFKYDSDWQIVSPSDSEGNPCYIYFSKGKHKIRLTNTLGNFGDLLRKIENSSQDLSNLYRNVQMVVGTSVDPNRDYQLEKYIPDLMTTIKEQYKNFTDYIAEIEKTSGAGEQTVSIQKVQTQLKYYIDNPAKIPSKISSLSDCISSLASWISTVTDQAVLVDYISLISPENELPRADCGFFGKILDEIKSFIHSYVSEYTLVENSDDGQNETVELWLSNVVGRDQANVIKQLAESTFTEQSGAALNIELVDMSILLRAVAAGNGPDVGIHITEATPINYGIRSALADLSKFEDYPEVAARFHENASIPFTFDGKVFALPETETFLMMFVRNDILNDLGLKTPNTWNELYAMVPTLNRNYYKVSLPSPLSTGEVTSTGLNSMFSTLLLQNGASVYNKDGSRCILNELNAVNTFIQWSEMYTKYMFPKTTDATTYFRIGTAPIVFNTLSFYNQLVVGAPEIRGKWQMEPIPATVKEDGSLDRSVSANLTACVMYANAKNKKASWEFLKWWTSADVQSAYAKEIEALQGKSGRWMTANLEAMKTIGWSNEDMQKICESLDNSSGIPEVAGGYYVGRSVDNAIKSVINSGKIPRETILNFVDDINTEIISKRKELGYE